MDSAQLEYHPVATIFPMMTAQEFADLKADIADNGLHEPIWVYQGKIIDGRNRYRACRDLGIEPAVREWDGSGDLVKFVLSLNLHRRHLNESQRAMVAAKVANLTNGKHASQICEAVTRDHAAAALGVSPRSVDSARRVFEQAAPEVIHAVELGRVAVSTAAILSEAPAEEQRRVIFLDDHRAIVEAAKQIQAAKREEKRAEVMERIKQAPKLPSGKYRVFYADPPWKYNDKLVEGYGPAEYHYPTMTIEELCAMPVIEMVEDNAVLFLWVTSPFLEDSFKIIRAWGFEYKASFVWDKIGHNYGHYNSVRHEFLLVCTRGSCTPDNVTLFDSVQSIQKSDRHSEKPVEFRSIIETIYPAGERVELFARGRFDGWDVWGNEAK